MSAISSLADLRNASATRKCVVVRVDSIGQVPSLSASVLVRSSLCLRVALTCVVLLFV